MAYCGVLHLPQQRLSHRGRHRGHQQADPLDRAAGDRQLQCKLGGAVGKLTRGVDIGGPLHSWNQSVEAVVGELVLGYGGDMDRELDGGIGSVGERGRGGGRIYR